MSPPNKKFRVNRTRIRLYPEGKKEYDLKVDMQCPLWGFKIDFCKKLKLNFPWQSLNILNAKKESLSDERWASSLLEPGKTYYYRKRLKPITLWQQVHLLQKKHATGRWGHNLAEATLNETKDYAIIMSHDHDIDYMFSQSVDDHYYIYNLITMKEVKIPGLELSYRFHQYSGGMGEEGISDISFDEKDPYLLLIYQSDGLGNSTLTKSLVLPPPKK